MDGEKLSTLEIVRGVIEASVPFASHIGLEVTMVNDGTAMVVLADEEFTKNHVGSTHAGALFTLAEVASGSAMAGVMVDEIGRIDALVRSSTISYRKPATGVITATASTSKPGSKMRSEYHNDGRTSFAIDVSMTDTDGDEVASMTVEWVVTRPTS